MHLVSALLRSIFDGLLYPFRGLPPVVGLSVLSLLTAVVLLLVFKKTSDQQGLEAVKRRIQGALFEIRLFNADLRAILRAQREILRNNLTYLRHSAVPMLWTLPPLVLVMAQLQFHYGYRGLDVGSRVLLKVAYREGDVPESKPQLQVVAPPGLRVESPPVWIPSLRELAWNLVAEEAGDYEIHFSAGQEGITKTVRVTDAIVRRSPIRVSGFLAELVYPAERPLPRDSPFESIEVIYPDAYVSAFGWDLHWMIVYFLLSIVFVFTLRKPLGVIL